MFKQWRHRIWWRLFGETRIFDWIIYGSVALHLLGILLVAWIIGHFIHKYW